MLRRLVLAGIACLLIASWASVAGARLRTVAGGCGGTKLYHGAMPSWTTPAMSDSSGGPPPWPYALSHRHNVAALVFGYPLRAGNPVGRQNKILWIMRLPRKGLPLHITARPLRMSRPVIEESVPADSSPGEIYPSYVNVPKAGCWRISLRWAGHSDEMTLRYS
jgi:hypothetical protein